MSNYTPLAHGSQVADSESVERARSAAEWVGAKRAAARGVTTQADS